jgi:hypothetical membrane protein
VSLATGAIVAAAVASPSFSWTENALSDLGQPGAPAATPLTTLLFDGGLVLGGFLGFGFMYALWMGSEHPIERAAVVPLFLSLAGLIGVGVFPLSKPLHTPAAIGFYLFSMVTMGVYGLGNVTAGASRRGVATIALVAVHIAVWWWWVAAGSAAIPGLALPELAGALTFDLWVLATAHWHLWGGRRH